MKKNEKKSYARIETIVSMFVETEMQKYKTNKPPIGFMKKYFRYIHLGNRLVRKISATKNATILLKSIEGDLEVKILKGTGTPLLEVSIQNNELCWQNS